MDEQRNPHIERGGRAEQHPTARRAGYGVAGGALVGNALGGPPGR